MDGPDRLSGPITTSDLPPGELVPFPRKAGASRMSERFPSLRARLTVLGVLLGLCVHGLARADLLFLKDGFSLQGKIRREGVTVVDPVNREVVTIPRGFFLLDDGPRRIVFSPSQ